MKNKILQIHAKWLEKNGYTDGLAECKKELASLVDIRQVLGRKKKRKVTVCYYDIISDSVRRKKEKFS